MSYPANLSFHAQAANYIIEEEVSKPFSKDFLQIYRGPSEKLQWLREQRTARAPRNLSATVPSTPSQHEIHKKEGSPEKNLLVASLDSYEDLGLLQPSLPKLPSKPKIPKRESVSEDTLKIIRALLEYFRNILRIETVTPLTVGIIGAGAAGLRTAMFLQHLGIDYEILEASGRPGGRVFTYKFSKTGSHDYFDLGSMRYPRIKNLELTFELFNELGFEEGGLLIPYHLNTNNSIGHYNGFGATLKDRNEVHITQMDFFRDTEENGGSISTENLNYTFIKYNGTVVKGAAAYSTEAMEKFKLALAKNFSEGWKKLMEFDSYSMRDYLVREMKLPFIVVQWMERMAGSTGVYDLAFAEAVLSSMDFDYPHGSEAGENIKTSWFAIEGGSAVITANMLKGLSKKPIYDNRVVDIRMEDRSSGGPRMHLKVRIKDTDELQGKSYTHVVTTTTLSCLGVMETTEAGLSYMQRQAIRSLRYGASVKIGIKFKTRWWQTLESEQRGGESSTDRPVRTVVYPSYGLDDPENEPGVLMASYARIQDASRLGALIQSSNSTESEKVLLDVVYNDLAAIHGKEAEWYKDQALKSYAHDWYHDEFTIGAFAHFRPGQFNNIYPVMTKPAAKGNLHFAGEAISTHHAWIEGSLVSAWRAVFQILVKELLVEKLITFLITWPPPEEINVLKELTHLLRALLSSQLPAEG